MKSKLILVFAIVVSSLTLTSCNNSKPASSAKTPCACEESCGCKKDHPHENAQCDERCDPWHTKSS